MSTRSTLLLCSCVVGLLLAQERGRRGGLGPEGRTMRPSPVFSAIDADGDGVLSASEIQNASVALKKLDTNGDGQLTSEELRPNFGPDREGRGGPGGGAVPDQLVNSLMAFDKDGDGKLSKDEVPERMQGLFERGDANHDGFLTKAEIQTLAQAQSQTQAGAGREREGGGFQRMDPLTAALDEDKDGVISASEIRNAVKALSKVDKNGDGQITADEVRPSFGPGGRGGTPAEMVSHLFEEFDSNGDGKLSKAELPDRMQEMFDRLDENKDGFVTHEEMQKFMQTQGMGFGRENRGRPQERR